MLAGGTTAADTREVRRAAAVHPEIAVPLPAGLLPPDPVARSAIDGHPRVREALAARVADRAAGDRLRAGIYEAQVEAGGQRRHLPGVAPSESDWQVGLSRPLRLPAKRDADLGIGARLSERGRLAVLEARHAVSRDLLAAWFERARRVETLALLTEQARVLGALEDVVRRRQRAGDASRLEALQAEAALRVAEGQRLAGEQRARAATIALERNFPELAGLASAAAVVAPPDRGLAGTRDAWTARILEANHEIALQRAQSEVRRAQAVRAGAERTPDPTVGLRASSDRGGQDRILGVFVAIPLPGAAREAQQREALALADESAARVATVEREVLAGALTAYETVLAADRAWSVLAEAHARSAEAARLAGRAFELGEGTLTDVLLARRGLLEATLAERQAALDALEARARLYLDAHLLWDFDEE
jgi:outer membrane protein TolC